MGITTFEKILQDAYQRGKISPKKATDWLWDSAISKIGSNATGNKILGENPANLFNQITPDLIGRMVFFKYDPKHKKTLPYYDLFPVIYVVDMAPGGYYGLNLHYVDPLHRVKLMDALWTTASNKKWDDSTRLKISYGILKSASKFKWFRPAFKHYLNITASNKKTAV